MPTRSYFEIWLAMLGFAGCLFSFVVYEKERAFLNKAHVSVGKVFQMVPCGKDQTRKCPFIQYKSAQREVHYFRSDSRFWGPNKEDQLGEVLYLDPRDHKEVINTFDNRWSGTIGVLLISVFSMFVGFAKKLSTLEVGYEGDEND